MDFLRDEYGNPVRQTDEYGNTVQHTGTMGAYETGANRYVGDSTLAGGGGYDPTMGGYGVMGTGGYDSTMGSGYGAQGMRTGAGTGYGGAGDTASYDTGIGTGMGSYDTGVGMGGSQQLQYQKAHDTGHTGMLHRTGSSSSSSVRLLFTPHLPPLRNEFALYSTGGKHKNEEYSSTMTPGYDVYEEHEKKGIMDKIKDKLPGTHR